MRAVAAAAGVSLGNAYYYFGSKEHLIQAYYDRIQVEHAAAAGPVLAERRDFGGRLAGVMLTWVDVAAPYHEFAGKFFKNAAEPTSPLSPFSTESVASRDAAITLFRQVVDGADLKVRSELRAELPELLWHLHMGVVLFWVYDASEHQCRTRALVTQLVPMVDRLARMTRLPVARGLVEDLLGLLRTLRETA